ncbi:MAG TPA: NAD-dependent epimerase/dehydratase family protein [Capillimicrobium sp.]|nr:NAD-dependent epimerase/dehydratase family protein [Capillimicrobium sp.]
MRVVVTGATGNVGSALVRRLAADEQVDAIVGIARRRPTLQLPRTTWQQADVATADLRSQFEGADAVVHLAWLIQPSRDERVLQMTNVEGSARVFEAAADAGVGALVYASSIGAYSPGPKDRAVDESWPTEGIETSFYARHKAATERILDDVEARHPELRVVRLRPGLIFQREAATEIRRYFAGPFLPRMLLRRGLIPIVPTHPRLRVQAVHTDDVAEAYRLAIVTPAARGAYNVAAEPVLDGERIARLLRARPVPVPGRVLRAAADLTWKAHLQPTPVGWVDMGLGVPIMDVTRARTELGWTPRVTAEEALLELIDGMREGAGYGTPPLSGATGGAGRVREVLTGVGSRGGVEAH